MFANYQRMQPTKLFLGNFLGNSLFNLSRKLKESQPMYVIPKKRTPKSLRECLNNPVFPGIRVAWPVGETPEPIGDVLSRQEMEISDARADRPRRLAAVADGLPPRQAVASRPAMSRLVNPSSTALRCVFFASPR